MSSLSGISASSIKTNLRALDNAIVGLSDMDMASGLRPVYRITSCKKLSEGLVTDGILASTIPEWVQVKDAGRDVPQKFTPFYAYDLVKYRIKSATEFKDPIKENAVVGILLDESPQNLFRYMVDIIFSNIPYESVDGKRKWLSEDFLLLGFPVQVTIGFIDVDGNFRKHPQEKPISTFGEIPPDFTGLLGAITQETYAGGDFFQGTFIGFEYLLERFSIQARFPINGKEQITRTLARMLRWLAARNVRPKRSKLSSTISTSDATIGIPILHAMGVIEPNSKKISSITKIAKNIRFQDMPRLSTTVRRTIPPIGVKGNEPIYIPFGSTFLDVLYEIERRTNTKIFFNEYGSLVVSGSPKVREIITGKHSRVRVHDAVVGMNVIHNQHSIDLSQIENRIVVHKRFSGIDAGNPDLDVLFPNADVMKELDEVTKYYADNKGIGSTNVYYYDDFTGDEIESDNVVTEILTDHFRYYGMRGSCYMIGNPKIRVRDVLRLSDVRSFDISGRGNKAALSRLSKEMQYTLGNLSGTPIDEVNVEKSFRIKSGIDHFYIWKTIHYMGPDGYTTKVFFVKEADAYKRVSSLLGQHIRRRRKGMETEFV